MIEQIPFWIPVLITLSTVILIVIGLFVPPIEVFLLGISVPLLVLNVGAWGLFAFGNLLIGQLNYLTENPIVLGLIIILLVGGYMIWKKAR